MGKMISLSMDHLALAHYRADERIQSMNAPAAKRGRNFRRCFSALMASVSIPLRLPPIRNFSAVDFVDTS